jgi:hypothetical protein
MARVGPQRQTNKLLRCAEIEGHWFDTAEEIQAKSQRVLDTLIEKDFQEAFQKWRR